MSRIILLEKSRTRETRPRPERNFHVFYQLVQGAPRDEGQRDQIVFDERRARQGFIDLMSSADAASFAEASCTSVEGIDDQKEFNDTAKAMADGVGLDDATVGTCLYTGSSMFAACLALGLAAKTLRNNRATHSRGVGDADALPNQRVRAARGGLLAAAPGSHSARTVKDALAGPDERSRDHGAPAARRRPIKFRAQIPRKLLWREMR